MKPEIVEMFENHVNTVAPEFETLRKARQPKSQVKRTAAYGTPRFDVQEN